MVSKISPMNSTINTSSAILPITIYRKTSLIPSDPIEKKRFNINFHTLEPLGFEILSPTNISILITGNNIKGIGELHYHNVDNMQYISDVKVNETKSVNVPGKGELFLNVDNINNTLGDLPFSFKVTITIYNTENYMLTPTFDIRTNKIHNMTILEEELFNRALINNSENGMLMISENIRIFMPKCKYIKTSFSPISVLQLHEEILTMYNKLSGLNIADLDEMNKPRRNFVLVSARNKHAGYMSASSNMLDTAPENSMAYFSPGWGMFHEYGHLYDQPWIFIEVWNNMYSKYMSEKTIGFTWLWGKDRIAYENKNILSFYEDYLIKGILKEKSLGTSIGLYFFITLQEALGENFVAKMTGYYRNNNIPLLYHDYIAYAIAKNYKINAIPYMEMFGLINFNAKVIDFVIDNSTSTLMYMPKNTSFSKYSNISIPPTVKSVYVGTLPEVMGLCAPNSKITLNVNNNSYNLTSTNKGTFNFTIPEILNVNSIIKINSIENGKRISITKTIAVKNFLSNNIFKFYGGTVVKSNSTEAENELIATIKFDVNNNSLIVSSMGKVSDSTIGSQLYFSVSLYDDKDNLLVTSSVNGGSNANNFAKALNGKQFKYGYYIKINPIDSNKVVLDGYFENAPKEVLPFNFKDIDLTKVKFYLKNTGILYKPTLGNNIFSFYGLKNALIATVELDTVNKFLSVKSTGVVAHRFLVNKLYFSLALYDYNGRLIIIYSVNGDSNAIDFAGTLSGEPFKEGYYIKIFHKEPSRLSLDGEIINAPNNKVPLTFGYIDLSRVTFYIGNNNIKYVYV